MSAFHAAATTSPYHTFSPSSTGGFHGYHLLDRRCRRALRRCLLVAEGLGCPQSFADRFDGFMWRLTLIFNPRMERLVRHAHYGGEIL